MEWTSLNDLREKYLSFFESKGHLRLPSFPLVPQGDKSLLLINSGMAPMKKFFTGEVEPPRSRVTTCQKCIRTPDLERVGHTARHGTFFEMLGNFSFGDYFKEEAIPWAWEFLTVTLAIPEEKLYPSIYENDEQAFEIWRRLGVPAERITRLGKADNFWEHGTGPCGPCSEIYFDRGLKYGCGRPDCAPGCDCDRFMEIWNNVFTQFDNDGNGNYTELAQKNIDTGMGLERLACVMQGVDNMFEVDSIRAIIDAVCAVCGKTYGADKNNDISIRVITDHIRSASFMICDGVIPSNEGRGYVLRRIIRRACRHGKLLGINHPFLTGLCDVMIGESVSAYPELGEKQDYIKKVISMEEERFDATIDAGLSILSDLIHGAVSDHASVISGEEVFRLYDTFGFPIDLTREIAAENNLGIDEETFEALMRAQKERARQARANISGWSEMSKGVLSELPATVFTGYTEDRTEAKVLAILVDEGTVDSVSEGDCTVVLDRTSFYGEGGGQVGDTGTIYSADKSVMLHVYDTRKTDGVYVHLCTMVGGTLSVGDEVTTDVEDARRAAIRRNHSACHLLQAALRAVLGSHVEQAGSYVDNERVRFDFSHFQAVTPDELAKVEGLVNAHILAANAVTTIETDIETARANGAMALFGEKYGDVVRMVKMGDFSTELCGGTHVDNTGKIGLFKIVSESSVAAGVRRIEGVTGAGVLRLLGEYRRTMTEAAEAMKCGQPEEIAHRAAQVMGELHETQRALEAANAKLAGFKVEGLFGNTRDVNGVKLVAAAFASTNADALRTMCDRCRDLGDDTTVVVLAGMREEEGAVSFCCYCAPEAVKRGAHAGNLVRQVAAMCGGKGGGRPDSAMAGAKDLSNVDNALNAVDDILAGMLK